MSYSSSCVRSFSLFPSQWLKSYKSTLNDHFVRLTSKASSSWNLRFTQSVQSFQAARNQFMLNQSKSEMPTLEDYIEMRRELHGSTMSFVIAELLEIFEIPDLQRAGAENLESLKQSAFDIVAWSTVNILSFLLYIWVSFNLIKLRMWFLTELTNQEGSPKISLQSSCYTKISRYRVP